MAEFIGNALTWIFTTLSNFGMWIASDIKNVILFFVIVFAMIIGILLLKNA